MSDDLDFIVIDDIPEYVFCIPDDEELENVIPIKGEDGSFKYEKVAELPETGEDGVLYLVPKSHETQTASGNPISINVTEGAGKLSDLKLDSDASQQTYSGKNLINTNALSRTLPYQTTSRGITFTLNADGSITINGKNDGTGNSTFTLYNATTPLVIVGGTYTGDLNPSDDVYRAVSIVVYDGAHYRGFAQNSTQLLDASNALLYLQITSGESTQFSNYTIFPMLESGTSKSPYEPFVGSIDGSITPSPNPSYPQPIYNVTGTQTISIDGTSYPIDLGNIELAEIGTYRDRIYKNDGKWYVEKQVGKVVLDGTEAWSATTLTTGTRYFTVKNDIGLRPSNSNGSDIISNYFGGVSYVAYYQAGGVYGISHSIYQSNNYIQLLFAQSIGDSTAIATWLSTHNTTVYYVLATPTTTQITDTNLINQLEAARNAALANGTNVISNTATGNNLAGDLELSYYEYDPTNKYNKWLWLDDDAAYEQM